MGSRLRAFSGGAVAKNPSASAGDTVSLGPGRFHMPGGN